MRKPAFCICKNKGADQLRCNRTVDQPLCFPNIYCTIPLLPRSGISSLKPSSVTEQSDLSQEQEDRFSRDTAFNWNILYQTNCQVNL